MNLVLLAGNSLSNKNWIEEVAGAMEPLFEKITIHYYKHWETGDELIDLDGELAALADTVKGLGSWVVFAKSAGTLLTLKGIKEGKISPAKCIFAGIAVDWGREKGFPVDEWLNGYATPTLFIQKSFDPAYSFANLQSLLQEKSVQNFETREILGENHHYEDIHLLQQEVREFILHS